MLESLIIFSLLTFVNPADPTGTTRYPAGVLECDKKKFNVPPASKNPLLKLSFPIYTEEDILINTGIYEAKISPDNQKIILMQSKKIILELPIISKVETTKKTSIPTIEAITLNPEQIQIIFKSDTMEYYSFLKNK